jgi:hypothetical protein
MGDMTEKIYESHAYGRAALRKLGKISENFRLFDCGWVGGGQPDQWIGMKCIGAEFRIALKGRNKGKLSIIVPGTERTVYVSREEIAAESPRPAHPSKNEVVAT